MADDTEDGAFDGSSDANEVTPVGVKLGSTRTVLQYPKDGEIETVRTLTCLATYEDALTGEEKVLYGEQAAQEFPDTVEFMLRSGLPEDDDRAELAGKFFTELVRAQDITEVSENSPIGQTLVRSFPESLCGAVPAMGDGLEAIDEVFVAVNMGSTNLEACAYRHAEQLEPFS